MDSLNEGDLIDLLCGIIDKYGSQKAAAERLGVSAQYLNDVQRDPGCLPAAMGGAVRGIMR